VQLADISCMQPFNECPHWRRGVWQSRFNSIVMRIIVVQGKTYSGTVHISLAAPHRLIQRTPHEPIVPRLCRAGRGRFAVRLRRQ
jgi:hypothetical protein